MFSKLFLAMITAGTALLVAGAANASPMLQIVPGGTGTPGFPCVPFPDTPPSNVTGCPAGSNGTPDAANSMQIGTIEVGVMAFPGNTQGYIGQVDLTGGPATVRFTLIGDGDASFNNEFCAGAGFAQCFTLHVNPFGTTFTVQNVGDGLIPFEFITGATAPKTVVNGSNTFDPFNPNFFITNSSNPSSLNASLVGTSMDLGLSDSGSTSDHCGVGVAGDCDYQDMRVRVAVPEPSSIALLAAALGGLGFSRRRKLG